MTSWAPTCPRKISLDELRQLVDDMGHGPLTLPGVTLTAMRAEHRTAALCAALRHHGFNPDEIHTFDVNRREVVLHVWDRTAGAGVDLDEKVEAMKVTVHIPILIDSDPNTHYRTESGWR